MAYNVTVDGTTLNITASQVGSPGLTGATGDGFTGGSYNASTGVVTFTSDDGLGFSTGDLRGADGLTVTWQGDWALSTAYALNDSVANNGSSYICIEAHTSSATDEPGVGVNTATYWGVLAEKGADGTGAGTVTSIDITDGTGITSTGGPVTSSGAITVALDAATQTSLGKADSALQPAAIGSTVQGYSTVLAGTTASYTTAEETKLSGIEALADVTDTTNVTAAGALMDSEVTNLAAVKAFDPSDYATAAQGDLADTAAQPADVETTTISAQTGTTYTLVIGDRGQTVTMDNASANTLTIPTNASVAFDVGSVVVVIQKGAGVTTITGDTGVTVNGTSAGSVAISAQYQGVSLLKVATDTWIASGAI